MRCYEPIPNSASAAARAGEGARPDVEGFLAAVRSRFAGHIAAESADWLPATGRYTSFEITG